MDWFSRKVLAWRLSVTLETEPCLEALKEAMARYGKGRFLDNIFVERLWRSLKYECVYLHAWETGSEAKAGVRKWMDFYNRKRPHSALGGKPPATVCWLRKKTIKPDQQEQKVA
ncbi:Integrase core domain-containing protein [Aliiruegeria lutimaris]|uniref:Integrase core domain-containing protein n=1 Tax=Aliiruegeria lutimaris TaxID=571298 RepID=A0A1G9N0Q4_9RHOB|nr:Integrase core domain-containing protein [Aliiruegeria lutimaris]